MLHFHPGMCGWNIKLLAALGQHLHAVAAQGVAHHLAQPAWLPPMGAAERGRLNACPLHPLHPLMRPQVSVARCDSHELFRTVQDVRAVVVLLRRQEGPAAFLLQPHQLATSLRRGEEGGGGAVGQPLFD